MLGRTVCASGNRLITNLYFTDAQTVRPYTLEFCNTLPAMPVKKTGAESG